MVIYKSRMRLNTLLVRLFIAGLSAILFLTGGAAAVGLTISPQKDTASVVMSIVMMTAGFLLFKASALNIRSYVIYEDRLEIKIFWGARTTTFPRTSLEAFNDLRQMIPNESAGIGIVTTEGKLIKILELETADFPLFVDALQKIVRWNLKLTFPKSQNDAR